MDPATRMEVEAPQQQQITDTKVASPQIGGLLVLLAAAGVLGVIASAVSSGDTQETDETVRNAVQRERTAPLDAATRPVTLLSVPILVVTATAGLVLWLHQQDKTEAALAIGFAPVAAAALGQTFTMVFPQRNPPDKSDAQTAGTSEASFPSGHTTGVTAEAFAIAYILNREELISPSVLAALLGWPFLVGASRLYRDRHWPSDIAAGLVAGTAVAACSALLYDTLKAKRSEQSAPAD